MNKRKKIGGGFIPDLEEYERENQIEAFKTKFKAMMGRSLNQVV